METVNEFSLAGEDDVSRQLTSDGRNLGPVEGRVIEAQLACRTGYVVITAEDDPWEETAYLYLLDKSKKIKDVVAIGARFHSGAIRDFVPQGNDRIEFSFFGDDRWRLRVRDTATISWRPNVAGSSWYPNGWLRPHYLQLDRLA